jgi:hypothetical protein
MESPKVTPNFGHAFKFFKVPGISGQRAKFQIFFSKVSIMDTVMKPCGIIGSNALLPPSKFQFNISILTEFI